MSPRIDTKPVKIGDLTCSAKLFRKGSGPTDLGVRIIFPEDKNINSAQGSGDSPKEAFENAVEVAEDRLRDYRIRTRKRNRLREEFTDAIESYR